MNGVNSGFCPSAKHVHSMVLGGNQWRDVLCNMVAGASIDWVNNEPSAAFVGTSAFADTQIIEVAGNTPVHVVCEKTAVAKTDSYELVLQCEGSCHGRHAKRNVDWEVGDLVLFDSTKSYDIVHPTDFHVLMWRLPKKVVAPMLAAPDQTVGMRIPGNRGPGAVLRNFMRSLLLEFQQLDTFSQQNLLMHLCGLVGLTLGASKEALQAQSDTQQAVRRQQIYTYIENHFHDPSLTVQRTARDLRMSTRWLYALLEHCEDSFAVKVAHRRLEESRKLLTDPRYTRLSISDIAFRVGFSNLSTFNRRFRNRYGMSPRDARQMGRIELAWEQSQP